MRHTSLIQTEAGGVLFHGGFVAHIGSFDLRESSLLPRIVTLSGAKGLGLSLGLAVTQAGTEPIPRFFACGSE